MITLPKEFSLFIEENGYRFKESKYEGALLYYESQNILISIEQDRSGMTSIDIKVNSAKEWIQICVLRSYLLNNDDYLRPTVFEDEIIFFVNYYKEILKAIDTAHYSETISILGKLMENRAKFLFG